MALGPKVRIEALRSLGFAAIGAAYVSVGTPFANPAQMLILSNSTDVELMISFFGGTDHIPLQPYSALVLDISSNLIPAAGSYYEAAGTQVQVKQRGGVGASLGSFDVSVFYGR